MLVGLPLSVRACEAVGVAVREEAVGDGTEAEAESDAVTVVRVTESVTPLGLREWVADQVRETEAVWVPMADPLLVPVDDRVSVADVLKVPEWGGEGEGVRVPEGRLNVTVSRRLVV